MKLALLQMDVALGEPGKNKEKVTQMIDLAMRGNPDVIALPELWNTGFFPANVASLADPEGENTKIFLSSLAKKFQVNLVGGSAATLESGKPMNTSYVFDRQGSLISTYHKAHLFSPSGEHKTFRAGTKISVFSLDGVKAAVMICYDLRFAELARTLALHDVHLLFIPAAWPHPRLAHWQTLIKARAIENQLFVAAINGVGTANQLHFCGHSMIADPWGEVLGCAAEAESILARTLDFTVINDIRSKMNIFADRKPALYQLDLCK